ncbi:MAG: restriction endonuclease subunit S [Thermofilaceae archaeon]
MKGINEEQGQLPEGYRMTELGPLPEAWRVVRLGEVVEVIRNGLSQRQEKFPVGYPITRIETIADGKINPQKVGYIQYLEKSQMERFRLRVGDILFSHINSEPHLGKTAIYEGNPPLLIHGMNLLCIRAKRDVYDAYFLNYLFNFFREKGVFVGLAARAVGQSSINQGKLKALPIPLPPLPEQRAIAHVLRTVQEAKEATERVIAALRELKKSLMRHLFTYGPVPLAQAESVPLRDTEIGPIPAHWPVVRLGEVALFETGKRERGGASSKVGILSIGGEHITEDGTLDFSEPKYISKAFFNQMKAGKVKAGDVLVCKDGAKTGKSAFVNEIPPEGLAVNEHIFIVRSLDSTRLFPRFLGYWFLSQKAWDQIRCAYHGLIGGINREEIRAFVLPLPPLPEQQQIAAILQAVDRRIQAEEGYKRALEALFKTLLHELMTARRRLPQDFIACFTESPNASGGTS